MNKNAYGFTIVELLIVIVVIGILAAISVVAYNNVQQNAKNSATAQTVSQWVRILNMYKSDVGSFPTVPSCLGSSSTYGRGFSGTDTTGGQCRQDTSTGSAISVNPTFTGLMAPFINGDGPTPPMTTMGTAGSYPWYRGAYFYQAYSGSGARIDYIIQGSTASCPEIGGSIRTTRVAHADSNTTRCNVYLEVNP